MSAALCQPQEESPVTEMASEPTPQMRHSCPTRFACCAQKRGPSVERGDSGLTLNQAGMLVGIDRLDRLCGISANQIALMGPLFWKTLQQPLERRNRVEVSEGFGGQTRLVG